MEISRTKALEQGFLFVPQCMDRETAQKLRRQVLAICSRREWLPPHFLGFGRDSQEYIDLQCETHGLPEFAALRDGPATRRVITHLLGPEHASGQGDVCRVVYPHHPQYTTRPHQDAEFLKREEEIWSLWIPLSDCPRTMGPLAVWPESHKLGLLPHHPVEGCSASCQNAQWTSYDFACGDALLVHKLTVHRALENVSEQIRVSVDFRFAR